MPPKYPSTPPSLDPYMTGYFHSRHVDGEPNFPSDQVLHQHIQSKLKEGEPQRLDLKKFNLGVSGINHIQSAKFALRDGKIHHMEGLEYTPRSRDQRQAQANQRVRDAEAGGDMIGSFFGTASADTTRGRGGISGPAASAGPSRIPAAHSSASVPVTTSAATPLSSAGAGSQPATESWASANARKKAAAAAQDQGNPSPQGHKRGGSITSHYAHGGYVDDSDWKRSDRGVESRRKSSGDSSPREKPLYSCTNSDTLRYDPRTGVGGVRRDR